jgi:hypothetical protein
VLAWYNLILIPAWYIDWCYIKSLAAGAGIELVPDLGHKETGLVFDTSVDTSIDIGL